MPSPERARRAVAAAALLLTAPLIVRDAIARGYAQPPVANVPRALTASSRALSAAAETALERGAFAPARDHAIAALTRAPVDQAALRVLAIAAARSGDAGQGAAGMRLAAGLGWRDTPAQILLLLTALNEGDDAAATQRADALARRESQLDLAFGALRNVAGRPRGAPLVIERLMAMPPYRTRFLTDPAAATAANAPATAAVLAGLTATMAPPTFAEVQPYVVGLMERGALAHARSAWFRLARTGGSEARALQDGDFAQVTTAPNPFGWQLFPTGEAQITLEANSDRGGAILDVAGNEAGGLLSQHLLLSPGVHGFAIQAAYASDAAREALRWQLYCLPAGTAVPAGAPRELAGDRPGWRTMRIDFAVPRSGCALQRLDLRAESTTRTGERGARFRHAVIR